MRARDAGISPGLSRNRRSASSWPEMEFWEMMTRFRIDCRARGSDVALA